MTNEELLAELKREVAQLSQQNLQTRDDFVSATGKNTEAITSLLGKLDVLAKAISGMMVHLERNFMDAAKEVLSSIGKAGEEQALARLKAVADMAPPTEMVESLPQEEKKGYDTLYEVVDVISHNVREVAGIGGDIQKDAVRKNTVLGELLEKLDEYLKDAEIRHKEVMAGIGVATNNARSAVKAANSIGDKRIRMKP